MMEERWGRHLGRQPPPAVTTPPHRRSVTAGTLGGGDGFSSTLSGHGRAPAQQAPPRWLTKKEKDGENCLRYCLPPVLPQHGKDVGGRKNSPLSSEGNLGDRLLGRHLRMSQQDHPLPHRFVLWASSRDGQCQGKSPPPRREPGGGGGSKVCAHPPFRCLFLSFPSPQGSRGEACVSQAHSNPDWVTVQNVKCCLLGRRLVNTKSCW